MGQKFALLRIISIALLIGAICVSAATPRLAIKSPTASDPWLRLQMGQNENTVLNLEATTNFSVWQSVGTSHEAFWNFPVQIAPENRFYRVRSAARTPADDWKNELLFPEESLRSPLTVPNLRWVKFAILLSDPTRVYYQDSSKFPFHYDFASRRLAPFAGMDRAAFDGVSLHRANQQVVLGAILYPPTANFLEYGVQFVGLDAYTPDEVSRWLNLIKATIYATNGAAAYYMPVFEQSEMARTNSAAFAVKGISIASIEHWISQDHVYSSGWAIGRLKYFPAGEIAAAFADGRLRPEDILLTDGVPAETPLVAGIISLTPSTPNSHTAILSQSFDIPFIHLPDGADQARVQSLVGRKILLRATAATGFALADVKVVDVEASLSADLEAEILALKKPAPIKYAPKESFGAASASTENLTPSDIKYFGGKAANYGLLRKAVPTNSPPAIAFSFNLWDTFMNQRLASGAILRDHIATTLAAYTNYPPDIPSLKTNLAAVRDLIRRNATFTAVQKQAITNALAVFDPTRKIRFRSSTNVEDSDTFTGAGLYESYSGCLLDDLDGDTAGPCQCDAAEQDERGVFRAIQRVYASFYNDNAFLERLRHGVDESKVGMGVLVHHSFPDEDELANGVATVQFRNIGSWYVQGTLVTQLGAESVTNPSGTSTPEVVNMEGFGSTYGFLLTRRSSLVPLGAYVMDWDDEHSSDDYIRFARMFQQIADRFHEAYPKKSQFTLDFEYKKDAKLGLVVKQVREIPPNATTNRTDAFLINEPTTWEIVAEEIGEVFANHRLKSLWNLNTISVRLAATNLTNGIYRDGTLDYVSNGATQRLAGPLSNGPNAAMSSDAITNTWTTGDGANRYAWSLETYLKTTVTGGEAPVLVQQDFPVYAAVSYSHPMRTITSSGEFTTTTNDRVRLRPRRLIGPGDILRKYAITNKTGVRIETEFYWPLVKIEPACCYTAPLVQFVRTTVTGLTPAPLTLTNYFSQTYHPQHHNAVEEFLFEPRLDPNVSAEDAARLNAANIQMIFIRRDPDGPTLLKAIGLDDAIRDL